MWCDCGIMDWISIVTHAVLILFFFLIWRVLNKIETRVGRMSGIVNGDDE